jgi:hypothetical protein
MIASCAWMVMTPHAASPEPPRPPQPPGGQAGQDWPAFEQGTPEPKPLAAPAEPTENPGGDVTPGPGADVTPGPGEDVTPGPGAEPAHSGPTPDTGTPTT